MKQIIFFITLLLLFINVAHATTIDIYYPHNNTTTDIYYACDNGYNSTTNNSMECTNLTILIIKDQIVYDDIINNPSKLMNIKIFSLFVFVVLFIVIIIGLIKILKRGI
jgi:hypothetical protein